MLTLSQRREAALLICPELGDDLDKIRSALKRLTKAVEDGGQYAGNLCTIAVQKHEEAIFLGKLLDRILTAYNGTYPRTSNSGPQHHLLEEEVIREWLNANMPSHIQGRIAEIVDRHETELFDPWRKSARSASTRCATSDLPSARRR